MTIKRILVAVGTLPLDEVVIKRGLELAAQHSAALSVVHILDLPGAAGDLGRPNTLLGQAGLAIQTSINATLVALGTDPKTIAIRIETGATALRLIEICQAQTPDIIVMRAHQRGSIAERLLGSTTDRVIAAGVAPVLVVKRAALHPYARVLIATNGTDSAEHALGFGTALLPNAEIQLVQAVQISPQLKQAMLRTGTSQKALTAHRNALISAANAQLRQLAASASQPIGVMVLKGNPAAALARATRSPNVDLIIVGPGRNSLIRRAFIGSVTRRLLRNAACDILICNPATD